MTANKWDRFKLRIKKFHRRSHACLSNFFNDHHDEATKHVFLIFSINTHRVIIPVIIIRMGLKGI